MDPVVLLVPVGTALAFFLVLALLGLWFKDRKGRRVHEEQMFALQHGLLPPEWSGEAARASFGRAWLWLAIGLPVFIAFAGGIGTALLVDDARRSGRELTGIIVAIWIVGGAVGLAAVIVGGLGLMANQRQRLSRPPLVEPPQVRPAPPVPFEERDPSGERFRKQERT